ncbi:MAG: alternative ribosome rescue aminoacyl-tRNA hydrolase ArfB [Acidimicrobiales bacterium]|nr:alternative ribosome rescue aminoacyl-tRNA hydrolase ArfB [Acidimicrobiales bacterium]
MSFGKDHYLFIKPDLRIPVSEIVWSFNPSGGPGGQHANKSNTRVEAELAITRLTEIDGHTKSLLIEKIGESLRVVEDSTRSQNRNRKKAVHRIEKILIDALHVEKKRKPTKPSRSSNEKRLQVKKRRSKLKADRKPPEIN